MIHFFHIEKSYGAGNTALFDLSFHIEKGDFVFLTGPSGAGKSTLLKLIFAAEKPTKGQLLVNGRNINRLSSSSIPFLRRNVGVVFQDFKLLPRRTIEENVAISLEVIGLPWREVKRRTYMILKEVGLAHKLRSFPTQLSGGEQQRVAIARALARDPQILLADEPTGNLDNEKADEIMKLLHDANARGTTVIVATHDQALVEASAKRVIHLVDGNLREY
ncbi:cell division ATP-binding protein FtsE [Myxococcota bacterium]|nr:cell division ATP-binding protein FtsE [Myxococcota bacterium]